MVTVSVTGCNITPKRLVGITTPPLPLILRVLRNMGKGFLWTNCMQTKVLEKYSSTFESTQYSYSSTFAKKRKVLVPVLEYFLKYSVLVLEYFLKYSVLVLEYF